MEKVTKTVYQTIDGRIFEQESAAKAHEDTLNTVKVFAIYAGPDLTEGRHGPLFTGYLLVHAKEYHALFAEHWCYGKYGNKIAFCMGVFGANAIMKNWDYRLADILWTELDPTEIVGRIEEDFTTKLWSKVSK